jgi:simple sugar transport system permease protein
MTDRLTDSLKNLVVPLCAVILALAAGAVMLGLSGADPVAAYRAMIDGAFGDMNAMARTFEKATPLIFSGLAIALALKAGLFNIGAQGQLLLGAMASGIVGMSVKGFPPFVQMPLALAAGMGAGALYGSLQGAMKARTGAHEVITGIMLNYVAIDLCDYLSKGPFMDPSPGNIIPRTALVCEHCMIADIRGIPSGFLAALVLAFFVYWFLGFTVKGFEFRTVGISPKAARYAGMRPASVAVLAMGISGALAGLGGTVETLGVLYRFQPGFNPGLGFEGITIALLARLNPLGVVPASILLGMMKAGAGMMQFETGVSTEIVDVIQALILFFLAADHLIRSRLFGDTSGRISLTTGWGRIDG